MHKKSLSSKALSGGRVPVDTTPTAPILKEWWPSRYGADDELGTLNELSPLEVINSARFIGNGQVYSLGIEYKTESPSISSNFWETVCLAHALREPLGTNKLVYLEELFIGCPTKGTHLDGPGHIASGHGLDDIRFYSGFNLTDVLTNKGLFNRFGMEKVPPIVTRGLLLDMVRYKGHDLEAGEKITPADMEGCLKKYNLQVKPGDALLIRTGWIRWFWDDPKKFVSGAPGITKDVVDWLYEKHVSFIATDQHSTEVNPWEDPNEFAPVQAEALCKRGFYLGKNFFLEELAKDNVYQFMFIFTHPKIFGANQGIGNPIAIGKGPSPKEPPRLYSEPKGKVWWPSRYGAKDELGTLNELHAGKVTEAAALIQKGKVFDLGTVYRDENPGVSPRFWHNTCLAHTLKETLGKNKIVCFEDLIAGCPGKGTHFDSPSHIALEEEPRDIRFYNGFTLAEVLSNMARAAKIEVGNAPPIVTRGLLLDLVRYKGHDLEAGEKITPADIEGCLKEYNLQVKPGDALLIRTGWIRWFWDDPKKFMSGVPGITKAVVDWLYDKHVSFMAIDQFSTEVNPWEDPGEFIPVHGEAVCKRGFYWGQNFFLEELAEDCRKDKIYETMFIFTSPKITGCTQGIAQPIAIK